MHDQEPQALKLRVATDTKLITTFTITHKKYLIF